MYFPSLVAGNVNYNKDFGADVKVACVTHLSSTIKLQLAGLLAGREVAPLHKFVAVTDEEGENKWQVSRLQYCHLSTIVTIRMYQFNDMCHNNMH